MFGKKIVFLIFVCCVSLCFSASVWEYIDKQECDQLIDKQLYEICYSYKNKGALGGWVILRGNLVSQNKIKKRPRFYADNALPMQYRSYYKDYSGFGKDWNRGHFIVADADFDYDIKALKKAYSMANIIPQSALLNQKTWLKVERYGRTLAQKFGYVYSVSLAKYDNPNHKIKNGIVIPSRLYRIYFNDEKGFEQCFEYDNELEVDYKNDKLKDHLIQCSSLKRSSSLKTAS